MSQRVAQVVVIGSGAGGAVTALELASRGFDVLVLEEGDRFGLGAYGADGVTAMRRLYRRGGMTPILGRAPIGFVEGCCVGGSTEINSGFWHRLPPEVMLRWKARFDLAGASPEELASHFDWAADALAVDTWKGEWPKSTRLFARGVEAMQWAVREVPRAARGCTQTNACASGCPTGAKQGMTRGVLPRAESMGARVVARCAVKMLLRRGRRVTGVLAEHTREDGSVDLVRIEADHVFVCAGPSQTPALLRRSGVRRRVGDTLRIHPMLKVAALFDDDVDAETQVLPLLQVRDFAPDISLGGAFFTRGHLGMLLSENFGDVGARMRDSSKMAMFYVAVPSTGRGSVRSSMLGRGLTQLRYDVSNEDVVYLSKGLARLAMVLLAAGAKGVYPAVHGVTEIREKEQAIRWLDDRLPVSALSLTTVHAFSTCPMGERADLCAADSFGRIFGYDNLYVNDASMLPDSPGVNPQGSVMSFARRNALRFAELAS